jgi:hypothetical protein
MSSGSGRFQPEATRLTPEPRPVRTRKTRAEIAVRFAAIDHTARQGGFDGSTSAKLTGPIPQIAMTAGSFWLRITPS